VRLEGIKKKSNFCQNFNFKLLLAFCTCFAHNYSNLLPFIDSLYNLSCSCWWTFTLQAWLSSSYFIELSLGVLFVSLFVSCRYDDYRRDYRGYDYGPPRRGPYERPPPRTYYDPYMDRRPAPSRDYYGYGGYSYRSRSPGRSPPRYMCWKQIAFFHL